MSAKRTSGGEIVAMILAGVAVLGGIGAGVWYFFFRNPIVLRSGATAANKTIPQKTCSPEFVQSQVDAALNGTGQGAETGATAGGGHGAAIGAAIGGVSGILSIVAGPCGPTIEKKIRDLLRSLDPHIAQKANKALVQLDRERVAAQNRVTKPFTDAAKKAKDTVSSVAHKLGF